VDLRRAYLPRTVPSAVATDGEGKKKSSITIRSIKSKLYSWGMRMERAKVHGQLYGKIPCKAFKQIALPSMALKNANFLLWP